MKDITSPWKFMAYSLRRALRHPRTPIRYAYCPKCKSRLNSNENECPVCHRKVRKNPEVKEISPVPWFVSVLIMVLGIICIIAGCVGPVPGLDEAGKAMVYIPLGNLFGLSIRG
jgi:uncharacterized paraquat-inducible protein A